MLLAVVDEHLQGVVFWHTDEYRSCIPPLRADTGRAPAGSPQRWTYRFARRRGLPVGRPDPQDRHRVHQARDPLLGKAIEAWQAVRPAQPQFAHRARRVAKRYINTAIIPMLCRKAGVPTADVRGNITSHRARSTIASRLYNAKEPMALFELQEWLGHRTPEATAHYAKITPKTLARAYSDAGYFARNVRAIEVLVACGAAAGEPWQYYDLGHGWCTYSFFEQCQHRMACARCDFYTSKNSSRGQLLEAKDNLQKMLANIPLTDDERAAVDDGQAALDQLLARLTDVPTPAGDTTPARNIRDSHVASRRRGPAQQAAGGEPRRAVHDRRHQLKGEV